MLTKLVAMLAFVALGALLGGGAGPARTTAPFVPGAFAVTLVWISFSYSGWNAAVYVAEEVRDPQRSLGRALLLATGGVTLLYVALNAVFLAAAPAASLAGRADVGAVAAEAIGGPALRAALSALVALALFTSISSMVMAGPRVYAKMAAEGLFPRALRAGSGAPTGAVMLQVALAIAALWASGLRALLGYIGFTLGLSAAATVVGLLRLRAREGSLLVPVPGYPLVPAIFVLATLGGAAFMVWREPGQAGLGLLTAASGLPVYAWMRRRRAAECRESSRPGR